jgi:hypothetical protein
MAKHKLQAVSGLLDVHFGIASVTFNIYGSAQCNFHDPVVENPAFDLKLNWALQKEFFDRVIASFLIFESRESISIGERKFRVIELFRSNANFPLFKKLPRLGELRLNADGIGFIVSSNEK